MHRLRSLARCSLWLVVCGLAASPTLAQPTAGSRTGAPVVALSSPGSLERAAQLHAFVQRWSGYVGQVYRINPQVWQQRLAPQFLRADATNVAEAMSRDAFDAALAALRGHAPRAEAGEADERSGRRAPVSGSFRADGLPLARLDSIGRDLTYTPLTPCRIVDTRFGPGAIVAGSAVPFRAVPSGGTFTAQGGAASDCGLTGQAPAAVVLNVTVVAPATGGFATVYPFGAARPLAASLNYTAGAIVNNSIVASVPDPAGASDFNIYSFATADYVVDIVGYFDTAIATPLACTDTSETLSVLHQTVGTATAQACPAGYASLALFCSLPSNEMRLLSKSADQCAVRNDSLATDYDVTVSRRCCRVPGR